ncbi:MAG: ABC transporter permease subunit [Candidatus Berkelbacteria bacterium]|nr:ABC transporter permease subunit [Candidatus Berkelbacteria bacterium]
MNKIIKPILLITKNTFKEAIRDKILYGILVFAILFLLSTQLFASISLGENIKVVKDLGLAGIYIFSLIITIFLGSQIIHREIENKTLRLLLSKPISIGQFVIGKFLGLFLSISANVAIMTLIYLTLVKLSGGGFDFISLWSILLLLFELAILIALTILFSTFTTPLAGTLYSIIVLYIGHSLEMLKQATQVSSALIKWLADLAYYLLPNLEKFNIRNLVVYDFKPGSGTIIYPVLYSILYTGLLLYLSGLSLKKRDL